VIEATGDALNKLQTDADLAAALPGAVESIPQVEEVLKKKAENRPVTPEEYTLVGQFVDRVERRTIQIKEEAIRQDEERQAAARAKVPPAAFTMPLESLGLKEHVFNILIEAGYETIGDLMLALNLDENKVLGLAGVGPKAMENMQEQLTGMVFPELPVEEVAEAEPVESEAAAASEVAELQVGESALPTEELAVAVEAAAPAQTTRGRDDDEEIEAENAKDGVSLDELFKMKPEIFRTAPVEEDDSDKKKGKKKKKGVELVLDEELGEVVGRKKHKRGEDEELGADE